METLACIPPYIRDGLKRIVGLEAISVQEAKSAQQSVLIVHFPQQDKPTQVSSSLWQVLRAGGNRLVVRIWKGGSRWWNLTLAKNVQALATAELEGYQWAHKALGDKIPQLLYACTTISKQGESPWAVFEYVGKQSKRFDGTVYIYDQYWTETMIKVRDEFGFAEPHPRWGRVPVDKSLQYAKRVLHQVTIPLHRYFFEHEGAILPDHVGRLCGDLLVDESAHGCTFMWMVRRYRKAFLTMQASLFNADASDKKLSEFVAILEKCVEKLESEHVRPLSCVLLHMDCQPQNLVFAKTLSKEDPWYISSVLDWEDSAYGDPRFELLLLGRKVCANRNQAESLWTIYQSQFPGLELGPIDTWLRLETVHSLCTLLLQSMDLLEGGRSPWETKPDLWGKIEREFSRLVFLGWAFCQSVALAPRHSG